MISLLDLALDFAVTGIEINLLLRAAWPRLSCLARWSTVAVVGYAGIAGEILVAARARSRRRRADQQLLAQLCRRSS